MRLSYTYLLLFLLLISCENPLENQEDVPADLIETTLNIFDGEIIEQGSSKLDDISVWKVKIRNSSDAITSFYWRKPYYNIFKIVGEKGPFDYNLNPPLDVISLNTAKFLAINQNTNDALNYWEFTRSSGEMNWYYRFYIKDKSFPISVDAGSGEIIR